MRKFCTYLVLILCAGLLPAVGVLQLAASSSTLPNGLISYWKLDETIGARIDAVGTNHLVNNYSLVSSSAGKVGNAASLDGTAQMFLVTTNNGSLAFAPNNSFTISAWLKIGSKVSMTAVNKSRYEYALRYDASADRFSFSVNGLFSNVNANNLGSPALNTWYHVLAWYDSTNQTKNIQVNNGSITSVAHSSGVSVVTNKFWIGALEGWNDIWIGGIDDVKIWNRTLTSAERLEDYSNGTGGTPLTPTAPVTDVYVSPNGSPNGNGTIGQPTDLRTALNLTATRAQPGATIWMRNGNYLYRSGLTSDLVGTIAQPITLRSYPGEWAVVDGWMTVNGSNVVMRNFEVTNSNPVRDNTTTQDGLVIYAPNSKFINLVVHDCIGDGVDFWDPAINSELYGCLVYNNGFYDPIQLRPRGHNIYTQNHIGTKLIRQNTVFGAFDFGIHVYSTASSVQGYQVLENISFNNGITAWKSVGAPNLFAGGYTPLMNVVFDGNYSYHQLGLTNGANEFGWNKTVNTNVTVVNNYFVGGTTASQLDQFAGKITFTNNFCVEWNKTANFTTTTGVPNSIHDWNRNTYFNRQDFGSATFVIVNNVGSLDFNSWKSTTGFDLNSTLTAGVPTGKKIAVLPNLYEPGRASIVVYNWDLVPTVNVDISSALAIGSAYEVRNAQNYFGPPVGTGIYSGGTITLPMTGTATGPLFNSFILLPTAGVGNFPPTVSLTSPANGASFTAPASITLSASAADSDGTVTKVEFYNGSTLLASDTISPYSFAWNNVSAGTYTLTAKATDNSGAITTSSPITITVNPAGVQSSFVTGSTLSALRNDFAGWLGMKITIGASPVTVNSLGRMFHTGNTATHTVKLVNAVTGNDIPNGSVSINMVGGTAGQFKYAPLSTPITLAANTGYLLVSQEANGGDKWANDLTTITTTPVAVCNGPALSSNGWTVRTPVNSTFVPVDFKYGPANQPPTISIASPADGSVYVAPASSVTITANASDSDGTVSKVEFFQGATLIGSDTNSPYAFNWVNVAAGTYVVTARATDSGSAITTSAPITVIVDIPPTVSLTGITNGSTFIAPATIQLAATTADADGTIAKVDFLSNGSLFATDLSSPYSNLWTNVAAGNYAITAQATDDDGIVTTSSVVNITVTAPVNVPPSVNLTSPLNGGTYTAPAVISLSANASDSDGTVSKVEFYQGTTLIATLTSAPYAFTWSGTGAGNYSITAKATDNSGAVTTSSPVSITVNPPANQPPTVSLTSPGNGALYTAPATLALKANATDSDGTISKVEFYSGTTLLATVTSAPYSFTWTNVPVGNYLFTAQATDNSGAVTVSDAGTTTITSGSTKSPYVLTTTTGTLRNDFTGWMGLNITVGSSPITVTDLGRFVITGNSASHALKIVAAPTGVDVPGTAVAVSLAGGISGQYVYATLSSPVTLSANTSYYILSQETSGGDKWAYWDARLTVNSVAVCNGSVNSSSSTWLTRGPVNSALGPVDLKYLVANAAPSVALTVPTNGASFTAGTNIVITATASDANGTVSKVDFYAGSTFLGTSASAPYSYTWANVPIGVYALNAIATDNAGATTISAAVNISITPVGGSVAGGVSAIAHRAYDSFVTTDADNPVAITLNALSGSGDALTYAVLTTPGNGILSGSAPNLVYTPNANFNGDDSFTFQVRDEATASAPATVALNVIPANRPPSAQSRSVATLEGQEITIDLSATDLDDDLLAFNVVTSPGNGSLTGTPPDLVYTPRPNFSGVDSFFFTASDGRSESPLAILSINVTPQNQLPVAQSLTLITTESTPLSLILDGSDPEGLPLTFGLITQPANGTLRGDAPYLIYTPASGFTGTDSFEFIVNDGSLDSIPATVSIIVTEAQ